MSEELRAIGRSIHGARRTLAEWALVGRDAPFERGPFVGRFDALQNAFCFSYFDASGEYRFQFSLDHAVAIANGVDVYLEGRRI